MKSPVTHTPFFPIYFCQCKIAKKSVWSAFVIVKVLLSRSRSVFIWAKMMKSYCLLKLETEKVKQLHIVVHATVLNKSVIYNNGMWHLWPTVAVCVFALFHVRQLRHCSVSFSLLCLNIKGNRFQFHHCTCCQGGNLNVDFVCHWWVCSYSVSYTHLRAHETA